MIEPTIATTIIQMIHFLILVYILNRIMFQPILRVMKKRTLHIQDTKEKMVNIENETAALIKKCSLMEKNSRKEAIEESAKLKNEALAITEEISIETKEEVSKIKEKITQEIEEKLKIARQSLKSEATAVAGTIADKIIGRRLEN